MTNDQNIVRGRHLDSLAADAKRFTLEQNLALNQAIQAELSELDTGTSYDVFTGATSITGGLSGLVPAPAAGDNTKFLRGDGTWAPVEGGREEVTSIGVYSNRQGLDGRNYALSRSANLFIGSNKHDQIVVTGSYNDIRPGAQGEKQVSLCGGASKNLLSMTGAGASVHNDVYVFDNASNNTIYSSVEEKDSVTKIYGDAKLNYVELTGNNGVQPEIYDFASQNTVVCGTGNDSVKLANDARDNVIICGAGNDTVKIENKARGNRVELTEGNNSCELSDTVFSNTVVCGTGNDTVNIKDFTRLNRVELTAGNNCCTLTGTSSTMFTFGNTVVCGTGNDTVKIESNACESVIICGTGNNSISYDVGTWNNNIHNFSNNDEIYLTTSKPAVVVSLQGAYVDGASVAIDTSFKIDSQLYGSIVRLQDSSATQFNLNFANNTAHSGVYTISGSWLVKAS